MDISEDEEEDFASEEEKTSDEEEDFASSEFEDKQQEDNYQQGKDIQDEQDGENDSTNDIVNILTINFFLNEIRMQNFGLRYAYSQNLKSYKIMPVICLFLEPFYIY